MLAGLTGCWRVFDAAVVLKTGPVRVDRASRIAPTPPSARTPDLTPPLSGGCCSLTSFVRVVRIPHRREDYLDGVVTASPACPSLLPFSFALSSDEANGKG